MDRPLIGGWGVDGIVRCNADVKKWVRPELGAKPD